MPFTASRMLLGLSPFDALGGSIIGGGEIRAPLVFSRAQAAAVGATGLTDAGWQTYGADVPRFVAPVSGLLIEGQRTNQVRNPRAVGAVAGSPGTFPTNWARLDPAVPAVTTINVAGLGVEAGVSYVELAITIDNTAGSGNASLLIYPEPNATGVTAANGETWTSSLFASAVGTPAGFSAVQLSHRERNSGSSLGITNVALSLTGALQRFVATRTNNQATTNNVNSAFMLTVAAGATGSGTFRLGWPQIELGPFASTPILPPVGTPGASTRGTDIVTAPLSALGIPASGACTVLWRGAHTNPSPTNFGETVFEINDGSGANRYGVQRPISSVNVRPYRTTSGVDALGASTSISASDVNRYGLALDGAGRAAMSINGAAPVVITSGPSGGLTTLRLGSETGGSAPMFGTVERLQVLPRVVSDAELAALVAAF